MLTIYDRYVNPRQAAAHDNAQSGGISAAQAEAMRDRFEQFVPSLASNLVTNNRSLIADRLPDGASWSPIRTAQMSGQFAGSTPRHLVTQQTPYQPEFASPDRQQYPVHRILANRYWRLFYKLDPVIGNCVEMYSDLPWSNFELTGEGVEGEIRQSYELMCRETQMLALLPYFVREFLVVGEVIPHTFFDNAKGIFTYIALHNPDQLEVVDAPFIKMDPIVEFIPDDRLRSILSSNVPSLRKLRDNMPPELLTRLFARQNIPLSPVNATFIPRKLHPYDTRGTSILSRLWRVLMLEDAIFNATIQTARRAAAPLKVAKLGNAATGWIPPPDQERRLLELLAQAELDPQAWLVYHYGVAFETIGTTDKIMSVNREWDVIERIKLIALGISKSFLHGEVSYASSATGLQVFLQRLKAMRSFFEQKWMYPKFFRPIAEINGWVKPKPNEVAHGYRVKRSSKELQEQNRYIVPKIVWDKSLDPQINTDLINAMQALEALGVKFSKTTKMATVGFSFEEESKKIHREQEFEKQFLPKLPAPAPAEGGGAPVGGGGAPPPPAGGEESGGGPPGSANVPTDIAKPPAPPAPPGASVEADKSKDDKPKDKSIQKVAPPQKQQKSSISSLKSEIWIDDKYGNWTAKEAADLSDLVQTLDTDSAFWSQLGNTKQFKQAVLAHNMDLIWDCVDEYLQSQGYPDKDIDELHQIMSAEGLFMAKPSQDLVDLEQSLPDNASEMSDDKFAEMVKSYLNKDKKSTVMHNEAENFLSGVSSKSPSELISDVSDLLKTKK